MATNIQLFNRAIEITMAYAGGGDMSTGSPEIILEEIYKKLKELDEDASGRASD